MNFKLFFSDLINTPLYSIPGKFLNSIHYKSLKSKYLKKDLTTSSFGKSSAQFRSVVTIDSIEVSNTDLQLNQFVAEKVKSNEMEVFGSGFQSIGHKTILTSDRMLRELSSLINESNRSQLKNLVALIQSIDSGYEYVNWNRDIISNYEFPVKTHFSEINTIIDENCVDVKNVWELGRMHQLTLLLPLMCSKEKEDCDEVYKILVCKILDFILSNPPRWGIHWTSAMEVSIRLFNFSIIRSFLSDFNIKENSAEFFKYFDASLIDHIDFAWEFREHKNGLSNNHYLANLVGVMYGSYAFISDQKYKTIFKKASEVFWTELDKQFLEDGGNFESSTCYHVFSTEMAAIGLAICFKADKDMVCSFDQQVSISKKEKVLAKIHRAKELIQSITLPNGDMPQFGDNDSARLFFMSYSQEESNSTDKKHQRNLLNYQSSLEIISSIFDESSNISMHASMFKSIMNGSYSIPSEKKTQLDIKSKDFEKYPFEQVYSHKVPDGQTLNLKSGLEFKAYTDFGLYLLKGEHLYLLINGMNRHVKQYWPHGHNDKLSYELWIGGKAIVQDPGSYTYTGFPDLRNAYRSVNAHATAVFEESEQNNWLGGIEGTFRMIPSTTSELLVADNNRLVLRLTYDKFVHIREFNILESEMTIQDYGNHVFRVNKSPGVEMSYGYGKLKHN